MGESTHNHTILHKIVLNIIAILYLIYMSITFYFNLIRLKLTKMWYRYKYPTINDAIKNILKNNK